MNATRLPSSAQIRRALAPFSSVEIPQQLPAKVGHYLALLQKWNAKVSLTSITSPEEILSRHFGECLFGARFIPESAGTLMDIGSGAGFPGLVLKLAVPRLQVTLVEPVLKKAVFLREAARVMEVAVEVITRRVDDLAPLVPVDVITTRAVKVDLALVEWIQSALTSGGTFLHWTTEAESAWLAPPSGLGLMGMHKVPGAEDRAIAVVQKT